MKRLKMITVISASIPIRVEIEPDGDSWYAHSRMLPGLHVGGRTVEEVRKQCRDAIGAYIESLVKHCGDNP